MSRRHWVLRAPMPRPSMSVPVAVYLRETYPEAFLALCARYGFDFGLATSESVLGIIETAAELDRIMRERPRPGRAGKEGLSA